MKISVCVFLFLVLLVCSSDAWIVVGRNQITDNAFTKDLLRMRRNVHSSSLSSPSRTTKKVLKNLKMMMAVKNFIKNMKEKKSLIKF